MRSLRTWHCDGCERFLPESSFLRRGIDQAEDGRRLMCEDCRIERSDRYRWLASLGFVALMFGFAFAGAKHAVQTGVLIALAILVAGLAPWQADR